MIAYIANNEGVTVFVSGAPQKVNRNHVNYNKVIDLLNREDATEEEFQEVLSSYNEAEKYGFDVEGGKYEGQAIHPILVKKLVEIERNGMPMRGMVEFCKNLSQNPFAESVEQLFDFLSYKDLPITEDGCLIAYKGVQDDGWSVHGNNKTVLVQGTVNDQGQIHNEVGAVIEVLPSQVDSNRNNGCSFGLHVGSFDYARSWASKLFLVKVNPKDVVSVPRDCSCQKCRVCKYEVLEEINIEIEDVMVGEDGREIKGMDAEWTHFKNIVQECLDEYRGASSVTLYLLREDVEGEALDNISVTEQKIRLACSELGYTNDDFMVHLDDEDEEEEWDVEEEEYDEDDVRQEILGAINEYARTFANISLKEITDAVNARLDGDYATEDLVNELAVASGDRVTKGHIIFYFSEDQLAEIERVLLLQEKGKLAISDLSLLMENNSKLGVVSLMAKELVEAAGYTADDHYVYLRESVDVDEIIEDVIQKTLGGFGHFDAKQIRLSYIVNQVNSRLPEDQWINEDYLRDNLDAEDARIVKTLFGDKIVFS